MSAIYDEILIFGTLAPGFVIPEIGGIPDGAVCTLRFQIDGLAHCFIHTPSGVMEYEIQKVGQSWILGKMVGSWASVGFDKRP